MNARTTLILAVCGLCASCTLCPALDIGVMADEDTGAVTAPLALEGRIGNFNALTNFPTTVAALGLTDAATMTWTANLIDELTGGTNEPLWKAVSNSVLSHISDTNSNPHGITPGMIGAEESGVCARVSATNQYKGNTNGTSWNFDDTNGVVLGSILFTPNLNYNDTSKVEVRPYGRATTIDFPDGDITVAGLPPVTSSDYIYIGLIFTAGNAGICDWNHNLLEEDGYLKFEDTNSYAVITNASSYIVSSIRFAATNDAGRIDDYIGVWINGTNTQTITPLCDGISHTYDLTTYAYTNDVCELRFISGIPNPSGNEQPWLLFSVPSADEALIAQGLANTNAYGNIIDLHGQVVLVDAPSEPTSAANLLYCKEQDLDTYNDALTEIRTRTGDTDLNGYVLQHNPRFLQNTSSNSLSVKYSGQTVYRIDGEGATVIPEIRSFSVDAGATATMTVWSYADGYTNLIPEISSNLLTWTRLDTNAITSASMTNDYTAVVVFTNSSERMQFVRLVDTSAGEGSPVTKFVTPISLMGEEIDEWPGLRVSITINGTNYTQNTNGLIDVGTVYADASDLGLEYLEVGEDVSVTATRGLAEGKFCGVSGMNGVAMGYRASVTHSNAFVFSDGSTNVSFGSYSNASLNARVANGVHFQIGTNWFRIQSNSVTMNGVDLAQVGAADGGATNIIASDSNYYDSASRTLGWNTNDAAQASGSGGATQLIANAQGESAITSTWDSGTATLTLTDLPVPSGSSEASTTANPVYDVPNVGGIWTCYSTNLPFQRISVTSSPATVAVFKATADLTNESSFVLYLNIGTNDVTYETNNVPSGWPSASILTGSVNKLFNDSGPDSTNYTVNWLGAVE